MAHGRLFRAAALGGVGTFLVLYLFWREFTGLVVSSWSGLMVAVCTAFGSVLLPPLMVWAADWLSAEGLGAARRLQVVGRMMVSQLVIIVPFAPLPLILWLMLMTVGSVSVWIILIGSLLVGSSVLLPMLALSIALATTETKAEIPVKEGG